MILIIVVLGFWRNSSFNKHGLITVCKVLKLERAGDGADMYLEVYFRNKTFQVIVDDICLGCVGNYYYCKVIPGNEKDIMLYKDLEVPTCIVRDLSKYDSGWTSIPKDTCSLP